MSLRTKLNFSIGQRKYLENTFWVFFTHGFRLASGFFIGLWLARYLGPGDYGTLNYITSVTSIFSIISVWGTSEVILKRLIDGKSNFEEEQILINSLYLRLLLGLFVSVLFVLYVLIFHPELKTLFFLMLITLPFQAFDVIDLFYRAKVKIKITSINRILILLVSCALKVMFILKEFSLGYFLFLYSFDSFFYGVLIYFFFTRNEKMSLIKKPNWKIMSDILTQSTPMMFVSLFSLTILRVDQIMVQSILGKEALGIYASAFKIIEVCNIIPVLLLSSLFTAVLNARKRSYDEFLGRIRKLATFQLAICLILSILIYLFAEKIIYFLLGSQYLLAAEVLKYLIFCIIPLSFSQIGLMWHVSEGLTRVLAIKLAIGVVVSYCLNYVFLKTWGIFGSSYPLMISAFITFYMLDIFHKGTRKLLRVNLGI